MYCFVDLISFHCCPFPSPHLLWMSRQTHQPLAGGHAVVSAISCQTHCTSPPIRQLYLLLTLNLLFFNTFIFLLEISMSHPHITSDLILYSFNLFIFIFLIVCLLPAPVMVPFSILSFNFLDLTSVLWWHWFWVLNFIFGFLFFNCISFGPLVKMITYYSLIDNGINKLLNQSCDVS